MKVGDFIQLNIEHVSGYKWISYGIIKSITHYNSYNSLFYTKIHEDIIIGNSIHNIGKSFELDLDEDDDFQIITDKELINKLNKLMVFKQ